VVYSECPDHFTHNVLFLENFRNTLGKLQVNIRKTGKLGTFKMFLTFSKNSTLWVKWSGHSEYTTLEPQPTHEPCPQPWREKPIPQKPQPL
jgi:hypothetical protein